MSEIEIKRTPEIIGAEIRTISQQARCMVLLYGIEIGRRLSEAKSLLEHGDWLPWLEREAEFSAATASRYMKLYDEYGADQSSLFGAESNFATLQNISVSNALRLLAIPAEEREEFAAEHDVENISARQMDELIKAKEAAEAKAMAAEEEARQAEEGAALKYAELADKLRAAKDTIKNMTADSFEGKEAIKKKDTLERQIAQLKAENKELAERPIETVYTVDEFSAAEAAELRRQLALADPDTALFRESFKRIQEEFSRLKELLEGICEKDAEKGAKLQEAVRAVAVKMQNDLS